MSRPANPPLLVALTALHCTLFPIPIVTLFWKDHIGMSLADIMWLQALFGLSVVILEFPSGYFADRIGYRASLLLGATLAVAGWVFYARGATFVEVAIAEVVLGAGSAFLSGADRALLWTSLSVGGRAEGQAPRYLRWEGRLRAVGQAAEAASSAVGGWLYAVQPRLPFWLQVPVAASALGVALALRETPRPPSLGASGHLQRSLSILRFALSENRRLRAALALSVAFGLSSFVLVWLIQPLAQSRGVAAEWLGPLWAAAHLWLVGVSLVSSRVVEVLGRRATLITCWLFVPIGYAGLALAVSPWGLAFYLCFMTLRGLQGPILVMVMQENAPPEDRAAVLSLAALLFRLAFVLVGPPIGLLADRMGMPATFAVLAPVMGTLSLVALLGFLGRTSLAGRSREAPW